MIGLIRFCIRHPVTVCMLTVATILFGLVAVGRLSVNLLPEISYPTLTIQTEYPDAAPAEVEALVTEPLEEAVSVVQGLRQLHSTSQSGMSQIVLEFAWGTKMDYAGLDVREKIDLVDLPEDSRPPTLLRFDPTLDPVMRVAAFGDSNLAALRHWTERTLKKDLESLEGVASARVQGGLVEEVHVELDEGKMALLGVSEAMVSQALERNNLNASGGRLRDRESEFLVRALNELADVDDITRVILLDRDGRVVRLGDVATVVRGHREREIISRVQGRECVQIALYKEGDSNTVTVARRVRARLAELRRTLPPGVETRILFDQAVFIENAIAEVRSNAVAGGLLAVFVLFFFLKQLLPTFIIGLSIPVSIVATFVLMQQMKVTLNIMSLGGLALGVGMLVDNSIVVLEAIARRRRPGADRGAVAEEGTIEVGRAVTASTLTTIAVFLPIIFIEGVAGQIFRDQALTVTFSLLVSLLVALTLIPMVSALGRQDWVRLVSVEAVPDGSGLAGSGAETAAGAAPFAAVSAEAVLPGAVRTAASAYGKAAPPAAAERHRLARALAWPFVRCARLVWLLAWPLRLAVGGFLWPVVGRPLLWVLRQLARAAGPALATALWFARTLANGVTGAILGFSRRVLFPPFDAAYGSLERIYARLLDVALRHRGRTLAATAALFLVSLALVPFLGFDLIPSFTQGEFTFQARLPEGTPLERTDVAIAGIEGELARDPRVGSLFVDVGGTDRLGATLGSKKPSLAEINVVMRDRSDARSEAALVEDVRRKLEGLPGATYEFRRPTYFSFRTPIEVQVYGHDLDALARATEQLTAELRAMPGLRDVRTSLEPGSPEVQVAFNRARMASMNLDIETVSRALRDKIRGDTATRLKERDRNVDILVRTARADQIDIGQVGNLVVSQADGLPVMLSAVADIAVERGPNQIEHLDQMRAALVSADLSGRDLGSVARDIEARLAGLHLPPGVTAVLAGQNDELQRSFRSLMLAMLLAVFMVYIVMACQFESLLHPFVILCTVPLGIVGVILSLFVTRTPISVVVLLGVIMLSGIVVNNAIVLIDYVNQLRAGGARKEEALREAAQVRLRPILMTTLTTVLGLLPMALGIGEGAEIRAPMAVAVIGGLTLSTLLTLVVIPAFYAAVDRRP